MKTDHVALPMEHFLNHDEQCTWIIEGPMSGPKSRQRPWWRRRCRRKAKKGTDRCWQHQRQA